jgi:hypothetical protein
MRSAKKRVQRKRKTEKRKPEERKNAFIILRNRTSKKVQALSLITNATNLADEPSSKEPASLSYTPSINSSLLPLKTLPRLQIIKCNLTRLLTEEPLEIEVHGKCVPYHKPAAKSVLYRGLQANKHVDMSKVVPPAQRASNCWFNAFFVTFFISDKGRKFFHFFRELMISGKQHDGTPIPEEMRDAFALLNYAIESSLSGSEYAYVLNTNAIIQRIYDAIRDDTYKIYKVSEAGNPIYYYLTIMHYLNNRDSKIAFIQDCDLDWAGKVESEVSRLPYIPNVLILEFMENDQIRDKLLEFSIKKGGEPVAYSLDSAVIRDTDKQHFSALITGERKEYGFDGYTYHRVVPFQWKRLLNDPQEWGYEGSYKDGRSLFRWSFLNGYQLLIYYRTSL